MRTGKPAEALKALRGGAGDPAEAGRRQPHRHRVPERPGGSHNNIGLLLSETGKPAEALKAYESALAIQQKLADANPTVTEFQSDLAVSHNNIGNLLSAHRASRPRLEGARGGAGDPAEAGRRQPHRHRVPEQLAVSLNNVGNLLGDRQAGRGAEGVRVGLAIRAAEQPRHRFRRLATQHRRCEAGKPAEAEARAAGDPNGRRPPSPFRASWRSHTNRHLLSDREAGRGDEGVRVGAGDPQKLAREHPNRPTSPAIWRTLNNMARSTWTRSDSTRPATGSGEAIVWQRKALAANPANPHYRQFLANHLTNLITAARGLGDAEGVAEAERELAKLRDSDPAMVALDARLSAIIKGDQQPKDNAERLRLAQRAYDKALHATAARLWAEALAADPKLGDDRQAQHRYNAACAAAMAGCWEGERRALAG